MKLLGKFGGRIWSVGRPNPNVLAIAGRSSA
jgi:hypothetical protein